MRGFTWMLLPFALLCAGADASKGPAPLVAFVSPRTSNAMLRPPTENQFDRREPIISARHAVERLSLHRRHDGTAEMCELDAFVHVQVDSLSKDSFADLDAATPFSLKKRAMLAPQQMVFEAMEQKSTSFADELKNAVHELCGTEKKIFNIPIPNLKSHGTCLSFLIQKPNLSPSLAKLILNTQNTSCL
mgnify:CR=1 FL=1